MSNLTILTEEIEKPHNLSAILRTCDAIGILEAHAIFKENKTPTFNSTAQGSQKWVKLKEHKNIEVATTYLKQMGFRLYGTSLNKRAKDYRLFDYKGPTAFIMGAEKWGLSESATDLVDETIYIPMRGMVQSLNVSVAAATLLFEALRQRETSETSAHLGEKMDQELYNKTLFEWSYPEVAKWCKQNNRDYPKLSKTGEILEKLPRTVKLRC
ncbi:tRNA (Guanosine18-2'-O-) -methyltransferase [Prochlorococcus sp. MIT 0602]|nr:tRNA (Guanosine18-2'-O-) -methyltransferase [Prochlorococcus sp. MIT 0602]